MLLSRLELVRARSPLVGEVLTSSVYALHGLFSGVLDKTVVDICEARAHIPGGLIGFIFFFSLYYSHIITIHWRLAATIICFCAVVSTWYGQGLGSTDQSWTWSTVFANIYATRSTKWEKDK